MSLDNIWLRSNDFLVCVSCVRFLYRSFASCIHSFHFVRSCIMHFPYRSCEAFVLFAFFIRLRLVHIVNLYDPGFRVSLFLLDFGTVLTVWFLVFHFYCKTKSDNKSCHSSQSDCLFCFYQYNYKCFEMSNIEI